MLKVLVAAALLLASALPLRASTITLTFTGGATGSISFTSAQNSAPFTVANPTGFVNGDAVIGLSTYGFPDQKVWVPESPPSNHTVDFSGVSVATATDEFNFFWNGSTFAVNYLSLNPGGRCCGIPIELTATAIVDPPHPVPLSSSPLLVLAALVGVGLWHRRRRYRTH